MSDQTKAKHHILPKMYLENFTTGGHLWLYDRKRNEFRKQPAKVTTLERAFYTATDKHGKELDDIEKIFSQIEGRGKPVIEQIIKGVKPITAQQKMDLSELLATLAFRGPESLRRTQRSSEAMSKEVMARVVSLEPYFQQSMDKFEKKIGKKLSPEERKNIQKSFKEKNYDLVFPKEHMLQMMLSYVEEFSVIYYQMEWNILIAPKSKAFITSDIPFYTVNTKPEERDFWRGGIGLLAPNCKTFAILSPNACIFLDQKRNPEGVLRYPAPSYLIDAINCYTAFSSSELLIAHNEALLKSIVKKTKIEGKGVGTPIVTKVN